MDSEEGLERNEGDESVVEAMDLVVYQDRKNVTDKVDVTYGFEENISKRGKTLLMSSDSFSFNFKRTYKNGSQQWECSYRKKNEK